MIRRNKRYLLIMIVSLCFLASCQPKRLFTEKVEKKWEVEPNTQLELVNENGDVKVEVWDKSYIQLIALKKTIMSRKELKKVSIETEYQNSVLLVKTIVKEELNQVTVEYKLRVPSGIFVSSIRTGNGNIALEKTKGDVFVKTINGNIDLKEIDGWITTETQNGYVRVVGGTGIRKIQTGNGSIDVEIANMPQEGTGIFSSNATINIKVTHSSGMMLDLNTSNGLIEVHGFGEKVIGKINSSYQAKIFEGGKTLFVKTDNGNITVIK